MAKTHGFTLTPISYDDSVTDQAFSPQERRAVYRVISERRDMRRFLPGGVVAEEVLARLLQAAHAAPSVGLMQPWRFIRITDDSLRRRIHALVGEERPLTAAALGERAEEFLALKVEGILECAELFVVALCDNRDTHVFGRRTLPQMDLASVSCAIQNLWLAARSEGLGMGWVSLFDPQRSAGIASRAANRCGSNRETQPMPRPSERAASHRFWIAHDTDARSICGSVRRPNTCCSRLSHSATTKSSAHSRMPSTFNARNSRPRSPRAAAVSGRSSSTSA